MKKQERTEQPAENSPEQVTPEQALERMRIFSARKENFVAAIKKSKNRDLSSPKKDGQ